MTQCSACKPHEQRWDPRGLQGRTIFVHLSILLLERSLVAPMTSISLRRESSITLFAEEDVGLQHQMDQFLLHTHASP